MSRNLDASFSALADPTRRAILSRLARGEATPMELGAPFAMSAPAISRHLRVLEDAGFITRRVDGTSRPCRLLPEGLAELEQWLGMLHVALETNYARLDKLLTSIPAKPVVPRPKGFRSR